MDCKFWIFVITCPVETTSYLPLEDGFQTLVRLFKFCQIHCNLSPANTQSHASGDKGSGLSMLCYVNSMVPRQKGRHFADDISKRIFLYENFPISNKTSSKYVAWDLIDNKPAFVQTVALHWTGDTPLSVLMKIKLTDANITHEKTNGHRELTVITVVTAPGPNDHGSVTARLGHGEVTARSQLSHG